jgi:tRNA threonylcarbamoyladenosine biosynthesis protein TsaB
MKSILALDTATPVLSAALVTGERHWYREAGAGLSHSELLFDLVEGLFKEAGQGPEDLGTVACMKGPGSFTGLRIGFSAAKGMALALGIPLIACPTLDCIAYPWSPWPGLILPVLDAKRGCFFTALYAAGGRRISAEMDADMETIARYIRSSPEGFDTPEGGTPEDATQEDGMPEDFGTPEGRPHEILLTGPDAPLFLARLREERAAGKEDLEGLLDRIHPDPLCRKGRALELAAVAKNRVIVNNEDDVLSAPEYLRKSDADMSS